MKTLSSSKSKSVTFEQGGAIRKDKAHLKEPVRDEKLMQALETFEGGAIHKPRKREPKRHKKIEQALAAQAQKGGRMRFHDKAHEYLYKKLSGRGGRLDSAMCRKMMFQIMDKYDPTLFQSYLRGKVVDTPRFHHDHPINTPKPRLDSSADVINHGGSLNSITHSENGLLRSHDSEFHNFFEIV